MPEFGKLNLASLSSHAIMDFPKKGTDKTIKCIVLPIEDNHMHYSEKGNVYIDLVAFERKEPMTDKDGAILQTHLVKQSLPKDVRGAMSEQEKRDQPIIGSLTILGNRNIEKPAVQDPSISAPAEGDDLPF